jgi:hypothetical protein
MRNGDRIYPANPAIAQRNLGKMTTVVAASPPVIYRKFANDVVNLRHRILSP